jgi:hypothetical protein
MSDNNTPTAEPMPTSLLQWQALSQQLGMLKSGQTRDAAFCAHARAQQDLIAALPARYATVLSDLLDRLESSALFTEESCSFSRKDLLESLQMWLDKARQQLPG